MSMINKLRNLDVITKVGFIILQIMIIYILLLFLLKPIFIAKDTVTTHSTIMGDHIMTFTSPGQRNLNIAALFLSFIGGFGTWLLIKSDTKKQIRTDENFNELKIIKKALSDDEKRIVDEIQKAGEITQDSLRFRLNWSKAKVSAILLQLDRMNIIQRERQGKTYKVFISKK